MYHVRSFFTLKTPFALLCALLFVHSLSAQHYAARTQISLSGVGTSETTSLSSSQLIVRYQQGGDQLLLEIKTGTFLATATEKGQSLLMNAFQIQANHLLRFSINAQALETASRTSGKIPVELEIAFNGRKHAQPAQFSFFKRKGKLGLTLDATLDAKALGIVLDKDEQSYFSNDIQLSVPETLLDAK